MVEAFHWLTAAEIFRKLAITTCCFFLQDPPNTSFFWKMLKKKLLNIFTNFFFYLKVQSFRLIMENNFIPMAASAGHVVAYTVGSIFKYIIDCVQLYCTNGYTNIVLKSVNCLWLVGVTLIFNCSPMVSNRSSDPAKRHQLCG